MEKNQAYTHLICAAQNMKNIAIKRSNIEEKHKYNINISQIIINCYEFIKNLMIRKPMFQKNRVCQEKCVSCLNKL